MTLRIHVCGLEELLHLPLVFSCCYISPDKDLNPACEMRSYLYRTVSFSYKNLNKVSAGRREIARELKVSNKKTQYLYVAICVFCLKSQSLPFLE